VGYAGYDVVRYVEHLPHSPPTIAGSPTCVSRFTTDGRVDHINKTLFAIALARLDGNAGHAGGGVPRRRAVASTSWWNGCRLRSASCPFADIHTAGESHVAYASNFRREDRERVRKCVEYIRDGDIFRW